MADDTQEKETRPAGSVEPASAHVLDELIAVAPGATVSRTIAKNKAGTLTLFAFDQGQELSEHSAPFDAWVQVVDGELLLTIDGKPVTATAGQLVLMPANIPHALRAVRPTRMLLTMLRG